MEVERRGSFNEIIKFGVRRFDAGVKYKVSQDAAIEQTSLRHVKCFDY